jgi:hypothetical protein
MISVIIPYFNQARFLIDCLESLAIQTRPPQEVIVVNDGSTDEDAIALCERLPHYSFPFELRVLTQENRGLSGARNAGIRASSGDVILPLDCDDQLLPTAIEAFEKFLTAAPEVDICYPDVMLHGNYREDYQAPRYNRWRHTQHNWLVCSAAIRRHVFEQGYYYNEDMRHGYEDWEFYLRACALGPFQAAPLEQRVFAYRKWGYSMLAATNHAEQLLRIRAMHAAQGLWTPTTESALRTRWAPSHLWFHDCADPAGEETENTRVHPSAELASAMSENHTSRFIWFGEPPAEGLVTLRFLIQALASARPAPLYCIFRQGESRPFLTVLDRLPVLAMQYCDIHAPEPKAQCVLIQTRGQRHLLPLAIQEEPAWRIPQETPIAPLRECPPHSLLPLGIEADARLRADTYYFFRRETLASGFPHPASERTLVLARTALDQGPAERDLMDLLRSAAWRQRFERLYLVVFEQGEHPGHEDFEHLVDAIFHLGAWKLEAGQKQTILRQLLEETRASDLLIDDCAPALEAIPILREAKLPIRVNVLFPPAPAKPSAQLLEANPMHTLASQYAALVDRVAVGNEEAACYLRDYLYFPSEKLKIISRADEEMPRGDRLIGWLFPEPAPSVIASQKKARVA